MIYLKKNAYIVLKKSHTLILVPCYTEILLKFCNKHQSINKSLIIYSYFHYFLIKADISSHLYLKTKSDRIDELKSCHICLLLLLKTFVFEV